MNSYEFKITSKDIESTNDELMKIWSSILGKTKMGWQYTPFKTDKIINVGFVSIHGFGDYSISFVTKTRSVVTSVIFTTQKESFTKEEFDFFEEINKIRNEILKKEFIIALEFDVTSSFGVSFLYPCQSENISIYCIHDKQYVEFVCSCYCHEQLNEEILLIADKIISILSTQTNSRFEHSKTILLNERTRISIDNKFQDDLDWIDEYPIENNHFLLPEYSIKALNSIIDLKDDSVLKLLRASHHYVNGLRLQNAKMPEEIIITYFMSCVEVLTEIDFKMGNNCECCGQSIYSIRKRVLTLIESYSNENLKKIFDGYYVDRSKYLHSGIRNERYYGGISLPQISDSTKSGCKSYPVSFNINLIEWTGYIVRKVSQELFKDDD